MSEIMTCKANSESSFEKTSSEKKSHSFSNLELFAGAGGLALGIEKAGFNTIALVEIDKDAAETLKLNRPFWNVICDDIANISPLDLNELFRLSSGELDLLSGGVPCQSFSYAG